MDRTVVQGTFSGGLAVPFTPDGARSCLAIFENNAEERVTWVTTHISVDRTTTHCICDGPSSDSIRRAATANGLPVDSINEVRVLDPYFYVAPSSLRVGRSRRIHERV